MTPPRENPAKCPQAIPLGTSLSEGHPLFVYGTLRQGCRNHHLMRGAEFVGKAHTKDRFALYSTGIPYVVRSEAVSTIIGEVYRVDHGLLAKLDRHEGHPHWYHRKLVEVVLELGQTLPAWLYFFDTPRGVLLPGGDFMADPQATTP
jgi:gamma-glutamylaminecyclotransferase